MSCNVLHDAERGLACLFCTTTDWAFGPVAYGDDAEEQMLAFTSWLPCDPREYANNDLECKWSEWRSDVREGVPA